MKKIMMLTLVLSVMAMGSAMANGKSADRKPKRSKGVSISLLMPPPPPVHHCCDCDKMPHHKCDKGLPHGPKSAHYNCGPKGHNKPPKGGKAGDCCPPHGKENKLIHKDKDRKPGRK